MKLAVLVLCLLFCFQTQAKINVLEKAMLIGDLDEVQKNHEGTVGGPMAPLSSMVALGFQVSQISFTNIFVNAPSDDFCTINVTVKRGNSKERYEFLLVTETGFAKSEAAREGRSYSSYSNSYKDVIRICTEQIK